MKSYTNKILYFFITLTVLFLSFRVHAQDCNITSRANDILPDQLCAPVNLDWEVTYRGVNNNGTTVEIQFDWDDGNPVETVTATETDPATDEFSVTVSHTYPQGGQKCNYNPTATLVVDGMVCTSSRQVQNVTVWDTDDRNGGELNISPRIYEICVGNDATLNFNDLSQWNCTPPDEEDVPNDRSRWIQWIYGTQNDGRTKIDNVEVDGTIVNAPTPLDGPINQTGEPVLGPVAPYNQSEEIYVPNTANVGEVFEVTLRNWNYCNPYDDPDIAGPPADAEDGDYPPRITRALIVIVEPPDPTINPEGPFCANDDAIMLSAATSGGTWEGQGVTNNSTGRFDPPSAGGGNHEIIYTVSNGACTKSDTTYIRVYEVPNVNITPVDTGNICPSTDLQIDANTVSGNGAITSHTWTGDTGPLSATNIPDPVFNSPTEGDYDLTYTVEDDNNCVVTEDYSVGVREITANPGPVPAEVCAGDTIGLNGNPSGGSGNYTQHEWSGDTGPLDQNNVQNPAFISSTPGTYTLTYTVTDDRGCSDNENMDVTVHPLPTPDAGEDDSTCTLSYQLNASAPQDGGEWMLIAGPGTASFTDTSQENTTVNVDQYGSYQFAWSDSTSNGCKSRDSVNIRFFEQPLANAGPDKDTCSLSTILDATQGNTTGYWLLSSGPGNAGFQDSLNATTEVNVDTAGQYTFTWTTENGPCTSTDQVQITFNASPESDFTAPVMAGCNPLEVNFSNQTGNASSYEWDFDNDSTSTAENPDHTFYNETQTQNDFEVQLTAVTSEGCRDSVSKTISVYPVPEAGFQSDATPACSPLDVNFTNNSSLADSSIWNYGDGSPHDTVFNTTHTFVNDTTFIRNYNVTLAVKTTHGCVDSANEFVTVYPLPDNEISIDPDSSCHPAQVQLSSDGGNASYRWEYGDGVVETTTSNSVTHTYNNFGDSDTNYTVTLITTSSFECKDTSSKSLTVHNKPQPGFETDTSSGCAPLTVNFENTSTQATTYTWKIEDSTYSTKGDSVFAYTFDNQTGSALNKQITLIASNDNGCIDSVSQTVRVYPKVIASFDSLEGGCSPINVNFNNTSFNAVSYAWDFGDGTTSSNPAPSHTFENTGLQDTVYTVRLIASSDQGCVDTTHQTIDPVQHETNADFSRDNAQGCAPLTVNFTNNSRGANVSTWEIEDSVFSTNDSVITYTFENTFSNSITRDIKLTTSTAGGCIDSVTRSIEIFPEVTASFDSVTGGCSPVQVDFTNTSSNADGYQWDFGDGGTSALPSPSYTYENNTLSDTAYPIRLIAISTHGCQDTATQHIDPVNHESSAGFTMDKTQGCAPLTVNFTNNSLGADSNNWTIEDSTFTNDSTLAYTFNNTFNTEITREIKLVTTTQAGCKDSIIKEINISPEVTAAFDSVTGGCSPLNINFNNTSFNTQAYAWDFGDGYTSNAENPGHTYENNTLSDTAYTIQLIASSSFGCSDTVRQRLEPLNPRPNSDFSVQHAEGCTPLENQLSNHSSGNNENQWFIGQGNSTDTLHTNDSVITYTFENESFSQNRIYDVQLVVNNNYGCYDTLNKAVEVYNKTEAGFDFEGPVCVPIRVNFENHSRGTDNYEWNFGDGTISYDEEPVHAYTNDEMSDTAYLIQLIAESNQGCTDTISDSILVHHTPEAGFNLNTFSGCSPLTIDITNTSSASNTYTWQFGNDTSYVTDSLQFSQTLTNIGTGVKTLPVTLIAQTDKGCADTVSQNVNVFPQSTAAFTSTPEGCSPFTPEINNLSQNTNGYIWSFGDGHTSRRENPEHEYDVPSDTDTSFTIELVALSQFGCNDTATEDITIKRTPDAIFEASPRTQVFPNADVYAENLTSDTSWQYQWHFGDDATASVYQPDTHTYDNYGEYTIELIASGDECEDTATQQVTIIPTRPVADFSGEKEGCRPLTVQFENESDYAENFHWDFGDGETSDEENPGHTYFDAGTYSVTLTVSNPSGSDTEVKQEIIRVYEKPVARFEVQPQTVTIPDDPVFGNNLSIDASTYHWDFGDGNTSTEENPLHYYDSEGEYTIELIAHSAHECRDTFRVDGIIAERGGKMIVPNAFTPSLDGPNNGNINQNGTNDVFYPLTEGVVKLHMQIYSRWGELIFETHDPDIGWNGYYRGELCKQDVYVYKIWAKFADGEVVERVGDVTLIR